MKKNYFTLLQLICCILPLLGQQTLVKDIFTGVGSSHPQQLVSYQNKIWFTATDGATRRIFSSDGIASGTQTLPLTLTTGRSLMKSLIVHRNLLYFGVLHPAATGNQVELWQSNGITSSVVDTIRYTGAMNDLEMSVKNAKIYLQTNFNSEKRLYTHTGIHGSLQSVATIENTALGTKSEVIDGTNFHFVLTNRTTNPLKESSIAVQEGSAIPKIIWTDNIDSRKNETGNIQIRILNVLKDELFYILDKQKVVNSVPTKDIALYKISKMGVKTKLLTLNSASEIGKTSIVELGTFMSFVYKEGIWRTQGGVPMLDFLPSQTTQPRGFVELMYLDNQLYMLGGGTGSTLNLYRRRGASKVDLVYIGSAGSTCHHFEAQNHKIYFVVHQPSGCKGYSLWTAKNDILTTAEQISTFHPNTTVNCNGRFENQRIVTPTHFYYGFDDTQKGFELWQLKLIPPTPIPDLAIDANLLSIGLFFKNQVTTFKVNITNKGLTPYSQIKIRFQSPTGTATGGNALPSVGTGIGYQRYSDSTYLYDWTIPVLAGGATASLTLPVKSINTPAFATSHITLQNSVPVDENLSNNQFSFTLKTASGAPPKTLSAERPTQQLPIMINLVAPNPTIGILVVHAESLNDEETVFDIYDSSGKKVLSKQIFVKSGLNQLEFDVTNLPSGFYFVAPATSWGQPPVKFIKFANI